MIASARHTGASGEAERCRTALVSVLADSSPLTRRLRRTGGTVRLSSATGEAVELEASAEELALPAGSSPTVEVEFEPGALDAFSRGDLSLTTAALEGLARVSGSRVSSLMAVSPILTGLLRAAHAASNGAVALPTTDRPSPEDLPPELFSVHVQGVHKSFGGQQVLRGVDLRVPEGAITVVLGPSGTGKSVLIKHLIGLLSPDRGDVVVHGRPLARMSVTQLLDLRRRYGVLFQDGALFGSMNVFDNVAFPLRQHTDLSEAQIDRLVRGRLEDVGLLHAVALAPGQLSGGMRKRVGFARALVLDPEIVLFDEPDSGLDPVRTSLLSDLVLHLHPRYGGTYVVITHNIAVARKLGQYLALLHDGRIVAAGTRADVFGSEDPFVRQFLAGEARGPLGMD